MKKIQPSISAFHLYIWYTLVNVILIAFTVYVHALLKHTGILANNTFIENASIWAMVVFKVVGANFILAVIFSEFKIK